VTDEQLAERVQAGDDQAFALLADRYAPMIRSRARARFAPDLDREDFLQIGLYALWRACLAYEPGRQFGGLAWVAVTRALDTAVKGSLTVGRTAPAGTVSLNAELGNGDTVGDLTADRGGDTVDLIAARRRFAAFVEVICRGLSPLERDVAVGILDGRSYHEIMVALDLPYRSVLGPTSRRAGAPRAKQVENALQRVRAKVAAALALEEAA